MAPALLFFPHLTCAVTKPQTRLGFTFSAPPAVNGEGPGNPSKCSADGTAVCSSVPDTMWPRQGLLTAVTPWMWKTVQGTEAAQADSLED